MSNLITQYSRLSHHTITTSGTTFSVPTQEDFTSELSGWTVTDLALSEIGVNEADKRAFIRIGDTVNEIALNPSEIGSISANTLYLVSGDTSASENQVLVLGADGLVSSHERFQFNLTGGTYIGNAPNDETQFVLSNGELSQDLPTGSFVGYGDTSEGNDYTNLVGAFTGGTNDGFPRNSSMMIWLDNSESAATASVVATHSNGSPVLNALASIQTDAESEAYGGFLNLTTNTSKFGQTTGSDFTGLIVYPDGNILSGNTSVEGSLSAQTLYSGGTLLTDIIASMVAPSGVTGNYLSLSGGSVSGNTSITYFEESDSLFGVNVGSATNIGNSALLLYVDKTDDNTYTNFMGVLSGSTDGDIGRNTSMMTWFDSGSDTQGQALIVATHDAENPIVVIRTGALDETSTSTGAIIGMNNTGMQFGYASGDTLTGMNISGDTIEVVGTTATTVTVPNLSVTGGIQVASGDTSYSGISGTFTIGSNTMTIVNGLVVAVN